MVIDRRGEAVIVVALRGAFDGAACDEALTELTALVEERPRTMVLDLAQCVYVASLALGVILQTMQMLQRHGGVLRLAAPSAAVLSVFEAVHFTRSIQVDGSVSAALGEG